MDKSTILIIAIGGAIGSVLRVLLSIKFNGASNSDFPFGTFGVNLIGAILIGVLMAYYDSGNLQNSLRFLLVAGFCGGFTTFSTFSFESMQLIRNGNWLTAIVYVLLSMLVGIGLTALSYWSIKKII